MKCPRRDFHIHTCYSDGDKAMTVAAVIADCHRRGLSEIGITDHMHDVAHGTALQPLIRRDIQADTTPISVYLGVEIDILDPGQPPYLTAAVREQFAFDYVVAGYHKPGLEQCDWPRLAALHHRQHLRICEDPLVDVLAHPYWIPCGVFMPPYDWPMHTNMDFVPESCILELAAASRETGTALEINACTNLEFFMWPASFKESYREYVGRLAEAGAIFSTGSDAHQLGQLGTVHQSWSLVEALDIPPERIWRPGGRPANTPTPRLSSATSAACCGA